MWPPAGSPPRNVPPPSRRGGSPDPPADFPPQRLELEQSDAPVWSSAAARLNFGPTAAAAWMRGQSLSLPRLTVFGSPLELGLVFSGGRGENELEPEGTCSRRRCESPPAAVCLLCRRGQRRSPRRAKPFAWNETLPKNSGRVRDPPLQHLRQITAKRNNGGASPSPTGKRKTSRGVYQKASVQRTPICTLCHGWSEPGAAVKWHRPKFCTPSGPSGPD